MLSPRIREVDVRRHVRRLLRRRPVTEIVRLPAIAEITDPRRLQVVIHQRELVARRQKPSAHPAAALPGSAQAAIMSCAFCFPVPTAVPFAPVIAFRKHPHFAPSLWSNG